MGANPALAGIHLVTLSLKTGIFYKTCKIYVLFTQRSFDIPRQNFHICNFDVIHYQLLWPLNCCETSTFGGIKAITCDKCMPRALWDQRVTPQHAWTINSLWLLKYEAVITSSQSVAHLLKPSLDAFVMTLEMAWRTRPLQLVLSGGPVTHTPTIEYSENTMD